MSDALFTILASAEGMTPPVFSHQDIENWDDGALERCLQAGLLRQGRSASAATCPECGETEDVVVIEDRASKRLHAYLACAAVGPIEVPLEHLQQWQVSYTQLIDAVFESVPLAGERTEILRDRVWHLGKYQWAGALRNVYFIRGLHRRDARQVVDRTGVTPRSVIFVPARQPTADLLAQSMPLVIPLAVVVSWHGGTLRFDHDYVEAEITDAAARRGKNAAPIPRASTRGSRLEVIEALVREMQEHLRAARDHAVDALQRTGTPQLLPRPRKDLLARKLGVHKSSVTRAFKDQAARELRFLWELSADLDRILERAGCHG